MTKPVYRRVVVKVSGEALMGPDRFGIHHPTLERIAADLLASRDLGVAIAVVVGGGNIFRGGNVSEKGTHRVTGDLMGMIATVMNALPLEKPMDSAAFAVARENRMPIIVFSIREKGAIAAVLRGEGRATVVGN